MKKAILKQIRKNGLKVMPDFTASGIWDLKTGIMHELEDLCLTGELQHEFDGWIRYYDTCFKKDYTTFKSNKKSDVLNSWGEKLAKKLKLVFPDVEIHFIGESNKLGIHKPKVIK
jgi:hypothetical protein